jgi:hypothetical protein
MNHSFHLPVSDSSYLEKLIEQRALRVARDPVMRTSQSMKLEQQENSEERLAQAIREFTDRCNNHFFVVPFLQHTSELQIQILKFLHKTVFRIHIGVSIS